MLLNSDILSEDKRGYYCALDYSQKQEFYSIMSITTKKESSSSRVETTTNEVLADSSVQEVISSDLALNLVMGADWMFRQMFSFHDVLKIHDLLKLRSFCKLFKISLPSPPLYAMFPSSKHATLQSLLDRLHELHKKSSSKAALPSLLLIAEGEHVGERVQVNFPISLIGAGREKTTLLFGLDIQGKKSEGIVEIEDLTIKGTKRSGLWAYKGMKVIMRGCTVEDCGWHGVYAYKADISCDDLQVIGCGGSGVYASYNATITLSGHGTSIQGNGSKGGSYSYGLNAPSSSSIIHLVHPLTKKQISTTVVVETGNGVYGEGTIQQTETPFNN